MLGKESGAIASSAFLSLDHDALGLETPAHRRDRLTIPRIVSDDVEDRVLFDEVPAIEARCASSAPPQCVYPHRLQPHLVPRDAHHGVHRDLNGLKVVRHIHAPDLCPVRRDDRPLSAAPYTATS